MNHNNYASTHISRLFDNPITMSPADIAGADISNIDSTGSNSTDSAPKLATDEKNSTDISARFAAFSISEYRAAMVAKKQLQN